MRASWARRWAAGVPLVLALFGCQIAHIEVAAAPETGTPALAIAGASAAEGGDVLRFPVSLSGATGDAVTVAYETEDGTATAGADYQAARGRLTFPAESTVAQRVEVRLVDDQVDESDETLTVRLRDPRGATLASAAATGTIRDDDLSAPALAVDSSELFVPEGGSESYEVTLLARPTGPVTVTVSAAHAPELTIEPERLVFQPARWSQAQIVRLRAAQDDDAQADDAVEVSHTASGGGYDGVVGPGVRVTIVEDDVATLAMAPAQAAEQEGRIVFAVTLSLASDQAVSVTYETGASGDTATADQDYVRASGTLRIPAHSVAPEAVEVTVIDDNVDEDIETLTVTLSGAANAQLAGGGQTLSATGWIADDDAQPALTIGGGSATEGAEGSMSFAVRLDPESGRTATVEYATVDGTATAGSDYSSAAGTLTFLPGTTAAAVEVAILDDSEDEETETFMVALSGASGATAPDASATGTIMDDDDTTTLEPVCPVETPDATTALELSSLSVTGGGTMFPSFDAGTLHYGLSCSKSSTLTVSATTGRAGATLTLLRADSADNVASDTGSLCTNVTVNRNHDVAVEVSAGGATKTYVAHCIPGSFPTISVLQKTDQVSDGLILATPRRISPYLISYIAVIDNNGVPRLQRNITSFRGRQFRDFRRHPDGTYSVLREVNGNSLDYRIDILDAQFQVTSTERVAAPLTHTDGHDFLIVPEGTGAGNRIFLSLHEAARDFTPYGDEFSVDRKVLDSVIQEVTEDGNEVFRWNSWDHREVMQLGNDCRIDNRDYAHINSIQLVDGDLVASFYHCRQVLRIDRSDGTGAVEWKLGGSAPPDDSATEYLELSGDPQGEFCSTHHATVTGSETVVLFDNGVRCLGPRKATRPRLTRAVEYDISSATQASYLRSFAIPSGNGYAYAQGGVTVLGSGADTRWLIAWGGVRSNETVTAAERIEISEVDPATGTVHMHLNMSKNGRRFDTYRAHRYPETEVAPPLNLP